MPIYYYAIFRLYCLIWSLRVFIKSLRVASLWIVRCSFILLDPTCSYNRLYNLHQTSLLYLSRSLPSCFISLLVHRTIPTISHQTQPLWLIHFSRPCFHIQLSLQFPPESLSLTQPFNQSSLHLGQMKKEVLWELILFWYLPASPKHGQGIASVHNH